MFSPSFFLLDSHQHKISNYFLRNNKFWLESLCYIFWGEIMSNNFNPHIRTMVDLNIKISVCWNIIALIKVRLLDVPRHSDLAAWIAPLDLWFFLKHKDLIDQNTFFKILSRTTWYSSIIFFNYFEIVEDLAAFKLWMKHGKRLGY